MESKNLLKYILIGIVSTGLFLVVFALFGMLIHPEKTFADGFKGPLDWILAVAFGASCAYSLWKKDNGGNSGKDNKQ